MSFWAGSHSRLIRNLITWPLKTANGVQSSIFLDVMPEETEKGVNTRRLKKLINVVSAHAEGEPNDVFTGGVLDVRGKTVFEK